MASLPFPHAYDEGNPTLGGWSSPTPEGNVYNEPVAASVSKSAGASAVVGTNYLLPASLRHPNVGSPEGIYMLLLNPI